MRVQSGSLHRERGEMSMIEDTIKAIKEAEEKASAMIADAGKQAGEILKESEEAVRLLKEGSYAEAKAAAAAVLEKAKEEGEIVLKAAAESAKTEAADLMNAAEEKTGEAVQAIVKKLLD